MLFKYLQFSNALHAIRLSVEGNSTLSNALPSKTPCYVPPLSVRSSVPSTSRLSLKIARFKLVHSENAPWEIFLSDMGKVTSSILVFLKALHPIASSPSGKAIVLRF